MNKQALRPESSCMHSRASCPSRQIPAHKPPPFFSFQAVYSVVLYALVGLHRCCYTPSCVVLSCMYRLDYTLCICHCQLLSILHRYVPLVYYIYPQYRYMKSLHPHLTVHAWYSVFSSAGFKECSTTSIAAQARL